MRLLFVHDGPFYYFNNKHYTGGTLDKNVWGRYLSVFKDLSVAARIIHINEMEEQLKLKEATKKNVQFISIPNISSLKGRLFAKKKINKILKDEISKVDGLIIRLPSEAGKVAFKLAKKLKKPVILEIVGDAHDALWYHGSLSGKLYAKINYLSVRRAVAQSEFSIYVTENYLQSRYPSKANAKQINCSNVEIHLPSVDVVERKKTAIKTLSESSKIKLGMIASLNSKYKGIDTAIKMMEYLKNNNYGDFELNILGPGPQEYWLKMAEKYNVQDQILFHGSLNSKDDVIAWIDKLDIYIHPSKTEGLPRALIEAMSRGCPSIASNVGGIPELLEPQYLHNPEDYEKLSELILNFYLNPEKLIEASINNYKTAKRYDYDTLKQKRTKFLHEFKTYIEA